MEINRSLVPGTHQFERLLNQLSDRINVNNLLNLSQRACDALEPLIQYSIFTAAWRSSEAIISGKADIDQLAPPLEAHKKTFVTLAMKSQCVVSRKSLKTIKENLFDTRSQRDTRAFIPRSSQITLSSSTLGFHKTVSARTGCIWLKRARCTPPPEDTAQRFFFALLFSIGLLCAHPFQDGNGRASRIALNTIASAAGPRVFPWSIFFLLRPGNQLYNQLLLLPESRFESAFLRFISETAAISEKRISALWQLSKFKPRPDEESESEDKSARLRKKWHHLIYC